MGEIEDFTICGKKATSYTKRELISFLIWANQRWLGDIEEKNRQITNLKEIFKLKKVNERD